MSSKTASTEQTWPENAMPTAEQLADWIARCTQDERVRFATAALRNEQRSHDCLVMDHDGELDFLRAEVRRLNADLVAAAEALREGVA